MPRLIAISSLVGVILAGTAGVALADDHDKDDREGRGYHERAPEPLTIAGLALGGGGIVAAGAWARRSRRKH